MGSNQNTSPLWRHFSEFEQPAEKNNAKCTVVTRVTCLGTAPCARNQQCGKLFTSYRADLAAGKRGKKNYRPVPSRPVAKNKSFVPYRPPRRENLPRGVLSSRPVEKLYTHGPVPPRPAPPTFYVIILPSRFPFFSPRPTKSKLCSPVPSRFSVTVIRLAFLVVLGGPFQRGLFRLPAFF